MARSIWKGPFVERSVLKKTNGGKIWSRRSVILPQFVGQTFEVHNGMKFIAVTVTEEMIGHKFGEFALTRKIVKHKKKK